MEKLEKLDKYVILPNVGFYGGFRYEGNDILLCEDHDEDEGYKFEVRQYIQNGKLITDLTRSYIRPNGKLVEEVSHLEVEVEKGELLVYVDGTGFTIPEYNMCKVSEAIEQYRILEG